MRLNARCQNVMACFKIIGHQAAFLVLMYVNFSIAKTKSMAKVFPKVTQTFHFKLAY